MNLYPPFQLQNIVERLRGEGAVALSPWLSAKGTPTLKRTPR
jgi:hypothetical protein